MNFPGKVEDYFGYKMHVFAFDGSEARIVEPHNPRAGMKWVWKVEFFDAFPKFELAMLERGYYLLFMSVGNTFGCPDAMRRFDKFYAAMTGKYDFNCYPILLGLSRGGLYVYNWACDNPDKVGAIYADNPVCDFRSWPGGKFAGPGSPEDWRKLMSDYHFPSERAAQEYTATPFNRVGVLLTNHVPLVHAARTGDDVVPIAENTDIMERRVRSLGGELKVFRHPGKHHPHGLDDPTPLIEWLEANAKQC